MADLFDPIKDIPEYFVSKNGKILAPNNKLLNQYTLDERKYVKIRLNGAKKCTHVFVDTIVAKTFIDNPDNFNNIFHKDGKFQNNNVLNLQWCKPVDPTLLPELWHIILNTAKLELNLFLVNKFLTDIITSKIYKERYDTILTHIHPFINNTSLINFCHIKGLYSNHFSTISDIGVITLTNLTKLGLFNVESITNASVSLLTNLTELDLIGDTYLVTDECLRYMTRLNALNLTYNKYITNSSIKTLTNLTILNLSGTDKVTDEGIINLKQLTKLDLSGNINITSKGISFLENLRMLYLNSTSIRDTGINLLTNLHTLDLTNCNIGDNGIKSLYQLTSLNLDSNYAVTNNGIMRLSNLTHINLSCQPFVTDEGIANLLKLKSMSLEMNNAVTNDGLRLLTNLEYINIKYNITITELGYLTNLKSLEMTYHSTIPFNTLTHISHLKIQYYDDSSDDDSSSSYD